MQLTSNLFLTPAAPPLSSRPTMEAQTQNILKLLKSESEILNAYTQLRRHKYLKTVWLNNYTARCGVDVNTR